MSFIQELKRRNVFRVAIAYVITSWLLLQVSDVVLGNIGAPDWVFKAIMLVLALGFPLTLLMAWAFELTPEGIKKEKDVDRTQSITPQTGRKLDFVIIALLAVALVYFIWESRFENRADGGEAATPEQAEIQGGQTGSPVPDSQAMPAQPDKSIAVLPFTTRSTDESDRFFSDGMHDDLLTQLAKVGDLKVISRTSVLEYRDTTKNLRQIGAELGVASILEGAVQRAGKQVRINVQLIDARSDQHLWAENYDRELTTENLFAMQTEIAKAIASALHATLSEEEAQRIEQNALTENLEALKAYQRARLEMEAIEEEPLLRAEQQAKRALELDPGFAAAWAVMARIHMGFHWNVANSDERLAAAKQAIENGRALDPDLPDLDIAEGYYWYWGFRDYENAIRVLEPVKLAYPNNAELHTVLGWIYRRQGKMDLALEELHKAFELEPRSDTVAASLSETYLLLRDFERAQEYLDLTEIIKPTGDRYYLQEADMQYRVYGDPAASLLALEHVSEFTRFEVWRAKAAMGNYDLSQDFELFRGAWVVGDIVVLPDLMHGLSLRLSGDSQAARPYLEQAIEAYRQALEDNPGDFHFLKPLCWAEGALEAVEEATEVCQQALEQIPDDAVQWGQHHADIAGALAMAGLNEMALDLVESVLAKPYGVNRVELELDPKLRSLHDEPRWQAIMTAQDIEIPGG